MSDISICQKCDAEMVRRVAKKGAIKGNVFLGCSAFPKCNYTLNMGDYTKKRLGKFEVGMLNEGYYKSLYREIERNRIIDKKILFCFIYIKKFNPFLYIFIQYTNCYFAICSPYIII